MKKMLAVLVCLFLAFSFVACGGGDNGGNSGNSGNQGGNQSGYYPDGEVAGQNTFTLAKKSKNGNDAVLTLSVGGTEVKFAGFKLTVTFDKKIEISEVSPVSDFMALTENSGTAGKLTLVFAGTQNYTSATEICDIALNTNGASDLTFKVEVGYGDLGYIDEGSVPPVKKIRGNGSEFKLA